MTAGRLSLVLIALAPAAGACGSGAKSAPESIAVATGQAATSPDPCELLTRAEAETVLGNLVADPYRSKEDTAVADPAGSSCAYATEGGRFLLLTPEWRYGKLFLNTERLVSGLVQQVTDLTDIEADTLEGLWDEAVVGVSGDLLFRKGARSITLRYLKSSTDAAGAIKLSGPALARLAAAPEPPRPETSSDGCPLPPDLVSRLVGMPVRLAPGPVRLIDACSYQLEADPTVAVDLEIKPVEIAKMLFEGLHSRASTLTGGRADSLTMGEEGWAYGSGAGSEAAVRAGGKVYHARMAHFLDPTMPIQKDAMVRLVAAMID